MPESLAREPVVIAGGGPNGLMLACELALAGVKPIVLERLPERSAEPKANGLVGQVVRLLDMRGLYNAFSGRSGPPVPAPRFYFGGMPVSFEAVPDNPMFLMPIPQPELVRRLEERAYELGVDIRHGHELAGLSQAADTENSVEVEVEGPDGSYAISAAFLVGADGGKSLVRKAAGIDFPGFTSRSMSRIAHVSVPESLRNPFGGLDVPGVGLLQFGFNRLPGGVFTYAELEPGRPLMATALWDEEPIGEDVAMTFEEFTTSVRRVLGVDLPIAPPTGPGPHALRRISGQNTRHASQYRAGQVFLVGDAAHVHGAMGGPGLNLGLQDAVNLGWKLAASVKGEAGAGLLDTYQSERHPVGRRVMTHSLAQTALMAPGPEVTALRELFEELGRLPQNAEFVARLMAGTDVRYDLGDSHELSGRMVPDLELTTESGPVRVASLLHKGRPVLLSLRGPTGLPAEWASRVDVVSATVESADSSLLGGTTPRTPRERRRGPAAMLIRPDGYVAWATDDADREDGLREALTTWCGEPVGVES